MANLQVEHGLLARLHARQEIAHMSGTRVGAAGLALVVEVGLLLLSADFPAFVVEDDIAFGAAPFDAPRAAIEAIVQSGFVLPNQGIARELIEGRSEERRVGK